MKKILIFLLFIIAVNAIISGLLLVTHPQGDTMGLTMSLLEETIFPDYFFPGILMILLIGAPHLLSLYYLGKGHRKQYLFSMLAGVLLLLWIIAQVLLIHAAIWLTYVCQGIGVLEILISLQLRGKWVV